MLQRSFFNLSVPKFYYPSILPDRPAVQTIPAPEKTTLFLENRFDPTGKQKPTTLSVGDEVKTGQKLTAPDDPACYITATVSGKIVAIEPFDGDYGRQFTAIAVETAPKDSHDEEFANLIEKPTLDLAEQFLAAVPGAPQLALLADPEKPIKTIIINGVDKDFLLCTNQYVIDTERQALKNGIRILKEISGIESIVLVVNETHVRGCAGLGADVKMVADEYPAGLPLMILHKILGQALPPGKQFEDIGVCFFSAEAIASIGKAFETGRIPNRKLVTVIDPQGERRLVIARIGTPIRLITKACGITTGNGDRIILGGPMNGTAIYTLEHPVMPDTDGVMIQNSNELALSSDYPCVNCGDCVRICPALIQINLLVRFLEAGQFEQAADEYDLYSCVECGLCSYVCPARIPIFQHIRLGKYELARSLPGEPQSVEEANAESE